MSLDMIDILIAVNKAVKKANAYTDSKTEGAAGGINYCGAVAYYSDLPANPEKGDAYTVKYAGSSGTTPDGTEYVWDFDTDLQAMAWIDWSKDCYTKAESNAMLTAAINRLTAAIETVTATYRGTYTTLDALNAASGDKNDFAFLKTTDSAGNEIYSRYSRVEIPQVVPEGYTQLLYISSNGTQYIDTGVQAKRDLKSYIKFTRNSWGSGSFVGARTDSSRYELRFNDWSGRFYCEIGGASVNIPSEMSSISEIVFEYPTVTVDDTVFNIPAQSDFTLEKNIYLCASNGNSSNGIISLYEYIIYDDDKTTELKHFYPCKNSSNVCGMYETVEGVFYPDANGGNFTAGPQASGYWNFEYSIPGNLFSSTQFAAMNSGIDSEKVQQIETNKTNISSVENNILSNENSGYLQNYNLSTLVGGTTAGLGEIERRACNLAAGTYYISWVSTATSGSTVMTFLASGEFITQDGFTNSTSRQEKAITLSQACDEIVLYTNIANTVSEVMISKTANKPFVPYAPSNAELYEMIKALQS